MKCAACGEERPDFGEVAGQLVCSVVCGASLANRCQSRTLRVFKTEPVSSFGTWTVVKDTPPGDGPWAAVETVGPCQRCSGRKTVVTAWVRDGHVWRAREYRSKDDLPDRKIVDSAWEISCPACAGAMDLRALSIWKTRFLIVEAAKQEIALGPLGVADHRGEGNKDSDVRMARITVDLHHPGPIADADLARMIERANMDGARVRFVSSVPVTAAWQRITLEWMPPSETEPPIPPVALRKCGHGCDFEGEQARLGRCWGAIILDETDDGDMLHACEGHEAVDHEHPRRGDYRAHAGPAHETPKNGTPPSA